MRPLWLAVMIFCLAVSAQPAAYEIRPAPGNRFALEVFKTGLWSGKKHLFLFERYHGTLEYEPAAPEAAKVELIFEAASIAVKDEWLSAKDSRKVQTYAETRMLAVAGFPEIRFVSTGVARRGEGGFEMEGLLRIRDIERPVRVSVRLEPGEGGTLVFEGAAEVKLRDYGLNPPSATLGLIGTKNEMAVTFRLAAHPVAETGAAGEPPGKR